MIHDSVCIDSYLRRIEWRGTVEPSLEVLKGLHVAHMGHIPYENLDILLGKPISIEPQAIEAKLVRGGRGGYCFEQNGLMALVLESLGFKVTRLAARVRLTATSPTPRTHQILLVHCEGQEWLVDVGFGGWGLLEPIPLETGTSVTQGVWNVVLENDGSSWMLKCPQSPLGEEQYVFSLEPQLPIDYVPANHYCSTHPDSKFVKTLTAQKASLSRRCVLRNLNLMLSDATGTHTRTLQPEELLPILREEFGLDFPAGTVFRTSGGPINPSPKKDDGTA